jgi:hypothetical protein
MAVIPLFGSLLLPAVAASTVTDLGKPTNALSSAPYFPLSGFHRIGTSLRQHGKPEILFLGTQVDPKSAEERWPVIKALEQFGSFTGLKQDAAWAPQGGGIPTFDWSHARYRSPYVALVHKELLTHQSYPGHGPFHLHGLSQIERALYVRYVRAPTTISQRTDPDHLVASLCLGTCNTTRVLPLILVGDYVQTVSQVLLDVDFEKSDPQSPMLYLPLPFAAVHDALQSGRDPAGSHLVEDVNAEANIITALICHADGGKPRSVCTRPAIKSILKHVK